MTEKRPAPPRRCGRLRPDREAAAGGLQLLPRHPGRPRGGSSAPAEAVISSFPRPHPSPTAATAGLRASAQPRRSCCSATPLPSTRAGTKPGSGPEGHSNAGRQRARGTAEACPDRRRLRSRGFTRLPAVQHPGQPMAAGRHPLLRSRCIRGFLGCRSSY